MDDDDGGVTIDIEVTGGGADMDLGGDAIQGRRCLQGRGEHPQILLVFVAAGLSVILRPGEEDDFSRLGGRRRDQSREGQQYRESEGGREPTEQVRE
jgi:hypothetical protein